MNRWIAGRALFPLHEWFKDKPTFPWLARLEQTQWLPPARLAELQWERLRQHLSFAYANTPYYRQLFDEHGLVPEQITDPARTGASVLTRDLLGRAS
jgi:phenylacetate-CoA ligase